jgi:hypothetical protein
VSRTTSCPICGEEHGSCEFASGSLYCVKDDCRNPHHRPRGPSAAENIAARKK